MPKIVRISFEKGIYGQAEPRIAGDGYAATLHNCDTRSGVIKPMKAPVADSSVTPASGYSFSAAKCLFEFQGSWYPTPEVRDWCAEKYAAMTRVFYTIPGQSTIHPQKIINGVQADLGTPAPTTAPTVAAYESASTGSIPLVATVVTVSSSSLKKGNYEFKVLNKDARGDIVGRGSSDQVGVEEGTGNISLEWTNLQNSAKSELYVKAPDDKQFFLFAVNPVSPHTLTTDPDEDFSKPWPTEDTELTPVRYIFTNGRNINGHEDESGPSPVSESIEMGHGRKVTLETIGTGSFEADATHSYNSPVASALAGGTALTIGTLASSSGRTVMSTTADHGLASGQWVVITEAAADGPNNGAFTVEVPADPDPYHASSIALSFSADANGLPSGDYVMRLTKVVGLAYDDWTSSLVGINRGAWSASSSDISFTVSSSAKKVTFVLPPSSDCDMAVIHLKKDGGSWYGAFLPTDGSPHGGGVTGYRDGTVILNCAGATWPTGFGNLGTPLATSQVKARAFSVPLTMKNPRYRSAMPTCTKGTGVQINVGTALTGYANAEKRTVELSGFTLNTQLNKKFRATITDAVTGKFSVNSWFNPSGGATETATGGTPPRAVFSKNASSGGTDPSAQISNRFLYRIGDVTEYLLVATLDPDVDEYIDTVKTEDLGTVISSYYTENGLQVIFAPPPADLEKIVDAHGSKVGISGNQVVWGPVNKPDAFPAVFSINLDSKPTSLKVAGSSVVIFTRSYIGRLEMTGGPSQAYYQRTNSEVGCIAPYSIQSTPKGIVFLADDGLYIFDPGRNTSYPIFPNRLGRRFFLSPSAGLTWGHWWYPSNRSFQYNFLTRDLPGKKVTGMINQLDTISLYPDPFLSVRSFYTHGKYFLFYPSDSNYANHVMLRVDLEGPVPVADFVGIHPVAAWVTEGGNPYLAIGTASGSLSSVMALEGTDPTVSSGSSLNESNVTLWRFMDELGSTGVASVRTGPMAAVNHERVQWGFVDVHGYGRGTARIWVDGWEVTSGGACAFVASETPTGSRRIPIPRGALGYTIDVEVQGMDKLIALEIGIDPPEDFEP